MKIEDLPRPANYRRQMAKNGGYEMVPAYTAEEVLGILEVVGKDAERYRWFVDALVSDDIYGALQTAFAHLDQDHVPSRQEFDECIDAAIKKGQV